MALPLPTTQEDQPRHLLRLSDWGTSGIQSVFSTTDMLKDERRSDLLEGKVIALIFRKPSTRTRISFEVAARALGASSIFMTDGDSQLGRGESLHDTAGVLSRYVDALVVRTYAQAELEALAEAGTIPVINALTDQFHPCQVLADLYNIRQTFGRLKGLKISWIGPYNNMTATWVEAAQLLSLPLTVAVPKNLRPQKAPSGIVFEDTPQEAAKGAHVIMTDVWHSMGEDRDTRREHLLEAYTVDAKLMAKADPQAIFMHCLPAHRGEEVTAEVIDGPRSRIFDQAECRLHVQKAVLALALNPQGLPHGRKVKSS